MTELAVEASRPVVGSSRKRMLGDTMSSMAMQVLLRSPPDTPLMNSVPTCDWSNYNIIMRLLS